MKLIDSFYDKEKKETIVILQTKYGIFSGKAYLHPDDEEYYSNYFGFALAELRAHRKFFRYKKRLIREQYSTLLSIDKNLYYELSPKGKTFLIDLLKNKKNLIAELDKAIFNIDKAIKERIDARDKLIERIKGGKNN